MCEMYQFEDLMLGEWDGHDSYGNHSRFPPLSVSETGTAILSFLNRAPTLYVQIGWKPSGFGPMFDGLRLHRSDKARIVYRLGACTPAHVASLEFIGVGGGHS